MSVIDAIVSLCPGAEVVVYDNDPKQITWIVEPEKKPSLAAIKKEMKRLEAIEAYRRPRQMEYPPIGDQLDALFHAGVFPDEMAKKIQAVKDKYPKE